MKLLKLFKSLVICAEDHPGEEERGILVRESGEVIVLFVPEALARHSDSLSIKFSNNCLNHDFIVRHVQLLDRCLDTVGGFKS